MCCTLLLITVGLADLRMMSATWQRASTAPGEDVLRQIQKGVGLTHVVRRIFVPDDTLDSRFP